MRMDLYWIDGPWTGKLAIFAHPRGGEWLLDEIRALKGDVVDVIVSLLTKKEDEEINLLAEQEVCEGLGLQFIQFSIDDVSVSASSAASLVFVNALDEFLSNT